MAIAESERLHRNLAFLASLLTLSDSHPHTPNIRNLAAVTSGAALLCTLTLRERTGFCYAYHGAHNFQSLAVFCIVNLRNALGIVMCELTASVYTTVTYHFAVSPSPSPHIIPCYPTPGILDRPHKVFIDYVCVMVADFSKWAFTARNYQKLKYRWL